MTASELIDLREKLDKAEQIQELLIVCDLVIIRSQDDDFDDNGFCKTAIYQIEKFTNKEVASRLRKIIMDLIYEERQRLREELEAL